MSTYSNFTTFPQILLPAAANGVTITPDSTAFNNSAYSQVTTGISTPIVIVGLLVNNQAIIADYRIDVATGASSSEVVKATITERVETSDTGLGFTEIRTPIIVPANTRVALRMRKSGTSTTNWFVKIVYYALEGTVYDVAADFTATADFTVAPNVVHNGAVNFTATADFSAVPNIVHNVVVDFTVTADFAVSGTVTHSGAHGARPVLGTLYLKRRL